MANDIAVVIEHLEGKVADISFEMLGKGRELAKASGGQLLALLLGHGVKGLAAELGCADRVTASEHETLRPYPPEAHKQALPAILKARPPRVTLVANPAMGMDLAAGLSGSLVWSLCAYCRDARLTDGRLTAVS